MYGFSVIIRCQFLFKKVIYSFYVIADGSFQFPFRKVEFPSSGDSPYFGKHLSSTSCVCLLVYVGIYRVSILAGKSGK